MQKIFELIQYRELVRNLVSRDLKVRYRNSVLGIVWSFLNPLLMMTVFTIVFGILLQSSVPYFPVFLLTALLAWNFTAASISSAVVSIAGNGHLIKKLYFPREILPVSTVLSNLVNFIIALPLLFLLIAISGIHISLSILWLPVIVAIHTVFILGVALLVSCVNVFFRDMQVIIDVLLLAWFFLSPIFYNMEDLSEQYARVLYWLNPMASVISSYRVVLYSGGSPDPLFILRMLITAMAVFAIGYFVFRRYADSFGEEV